MAKFRTTLALPATSTVIHRPMTPPRQEMSGVLEPAKAPWIRPGVIVHEESTQVDELMAKFALTLRDRGFVVAGYVQRGHANGTEIELQDLATDQTITIDPAAENTAAVSRMRKAMRDDVDLVVISHFAAMETAAKGLKSAVDEGISHGMPVLTSITGGAIQTWLDFAGLDGTMISPNMKALWRWWGADRLYHDLALGVAEDEVRQIACGQHWIMVEGPHGTGLAYLRRYPKELMPRLPALARRSLRQLADLSASWDPLEMALGVAAINAHYNRSDLTGQVGNGAQIFAREPGRVVAVGAFPGLAAILPNCAVIESDPRPGEYPTVAMDTLLPGSAAVVVNSSTLVNRNLPRILRLTHGSRVALVGPATPLTPRLYHYGIEILGGLVVRDSAGLGAAIRDGAAPREFGRFGQYLHIRREEAPAKTECRFRLQKHALGPDKPPR
jgi:hypothetical protein